MAEQQNIEFIKSLYAAFGRGDIQALLNGLTENVEWHSPGPPDEMPWSGDRRGRQQVGQFFQLLDQHLTFEHFEAANFFAQGDHVVVLGSDGGKVKSNGRSWNVRWVHIHTINNGLVSKFEELFDTAKFLAVFKGSGPGKG